MFHYEIVGNVDTDMFPYAVVHDITGNEYNRYSHRAIADQVADKLNEPRQLLHETQIDDVFVQTQRNASIWTVRTLNREGQPIISPYWFTSAEAAEHEHKWQVFNAVEFYDATPYDEYYSDPFADDDAAERVERMASQRNAIAAIHAQAANL